MYIGMSCSGRVEDKTTGKDNFRNVIGTGIKWIEVYWIKQGLWWDLLENSNQAGAKIIGKRRGGNASKSVKLKDSGNGNTN